MREPVELSFAASLTELVSSVNSLRYYFFHLIQSLSTLESDLLDP